MPEKSRYGKGKRPPLSKRRREKQRSTTTVAPQQLASQPPKSAVPHSAPVPSTSVPAPAAKSGTVQYSYITAELRRIGILAGIIVVILIVLALVLS